MSADLIHPTTPVAIIEHSPLEKEIADHEPTGRVTDSVVDLMHPQPLD